MVKTDAQLRAELVKYGRQLCDQGFCPATSGNLSVRLDAWRILITPTGVSKGDMKPEDMAVISPEGAHRFGLVVAVFQQQPSTVLQMRRGLLDDVADVVQPIGAAGQCL